LYGRKAW